MDINTASTISIGDSWREYRLGPVQFTGDGKVEIKLVFTSGAASSGNYFIDNLALSQLEDKDYLIKDSWRREVAFGGSTVATHAPVECVQMGW